jgi:hypothetical protein
MNKRFLAPVLAALACVALVSVRAQQSTPTPEFVPDEVLVKFSQNATAARRSNILIARAASRLRRFAAIDIEHARLPRGTNMNAALAAFSAMPDVEAVQPNYIRRVVGVAPPNDPFWLSGQLWGLEKIQVQQTWQNFTSGNGSVVIADIDTGVDYNHPDLAANMWHNPGEIPGNGIDDDDNDYIDDVYGIDTYNNDRDPMDDHGHGTHTSGTIAGVGNNGVGVAGVNWNAKILACKFMNSQGNGPDSAAIECFNYIAALKQRGINIRASSNSWGGTRSGGVPTALKSAIDAAGSKGIVNVIAAGNSALNIDVTPVDPASLTSTSTIVVAASDGSDNRADFSNYGPIGVDVAAPGVGIVSTLPGNNYASWSGTSMAAPHVAGLVGLLATIAPSSTVSQIKTAVMSSVDAVSWGNQIASHGRINAYTAAGALASPSVPTVAITSPSSGASFASGASVAIAATASDPDGIASVSFYADGALVSTDTTSPYNASTSSLSVGGHSLTATAVDSRGVSGNSAVVSITVTGTAPPPPTTTATFIRRDTTTAGTWRGVYGTQGYALANDAVSLPAYAQLGVGGAAAWTWVNSTSDLRALQRPAPATDRIAATWYSQGSFTYDVTLTDATAHQIAFYAVDWDARGRSQRVDVLDASTGAILDSQTSSGFVGGQHLVWAVKGHVLVRVTKLAGDNAVISGILFDPSGTAPPPANVPPTVTLNAPSNGASFVAPAAISLSATANDSDGTVTSVAFYAGAQLVGTSTSSTNPRTATWNTSLTGTFQITAVATDNSGATTTSAPVSITIAPPNVPPSVTLISPANGATYVTPASISLSANATDSDGSVTSVAFYAGAQLVGTSTSSTNPRTATWNTSSTGTFQITAVATDNSGATTTSAPVSITITAPPPPNGAPTVSLTSPTNGATYVTPASISLSANASDSDGTVTSVAFYAGAQLIGTSTATSNPRTATWNTSSTGTFQITAVAMDNSGATTTSAPLTISITSPPPPASTTVSFIRRDTGTGGNWLGLYGSQGYSLANDAASIPGFVQLGTSNASLWTWAASTTDPRGLQRPAPATDRMIGTWFDNGAFTIDLNLTDALTHQVSVYVTDWDARGRSQRIDVIDSATGTVLDTQTVSGFVGGQYLVWAIKGHVQLRVTRLGGDNAVASAVFFDAGN